MATKQDSETDCMERDIVILGGGMVGAATALALSRHGMRTVLVEASAEIRVEPGSALDPRVSAISQGSIRFLSELGAWDPLPKARVQPYRRLEVSQSQGGQCQFQAAELGLGQLGAFVENRVLQQALWQALPDSVETHLGSRAVAFAHHEGGVQLELDSGDKITARLAVAAEGANSWLRGQAGIGLTGWEYRQHCLLVAVKTDGRDADTTWQEFQPSGPKAFLPLYDNQAVLAWYDSPARIRELAQMTPARLAQAIAQCYPERLGAVTVIKAGAFPLVRRHAQHYHQNGVVLVGDAAHTINPLAGQGVNLGFKDAQVLAEEVGGAFGRGEAWWQDGGLARYQRRRRPDNLLMQTAMDACYKGFSNDSQPLARLRGLVLSGLDMAEPIKKRVLKYAAGL
ncbi:FAD-dependent oxidoreductase [Gallaecimonas sp. GXIMD4217]|uniref:FAD-dependent oxidoreductase n=1 Tax=Gallaecimonas sp. GXIMD4217 TaxID=3131927 RepID=UPI00311B368B